jgi:uncharacterized membrane protein YGL010W
MPTRLHGGFAMDQSFFARQLAIYASYHRDPRNRATHFVGIPAILFSLLVVLALWRLPIAFDLSAAAIALALALIGWIALDRAVGIAMVAVAIPLLILAEWTARSFSTATVWVVFAVFFVGGWILQLVGHVHEGRRPALVDNLFQAFIGPMFIMAEALMALGYKRELKATIDGAQ